jgi:spore maturation protein SpmB
MTDDPIVRASVWGTAVFAVLGVLAAATDAGPIVVVSVVVDLVLFAAGCLAFVVTLLRAAERSRTDEVTLPGIWWLSGSAPRAIRRPLLAAFGAEVVIGLATASARPFTGLAFGVLVPVYGLGLAGLWAARMGSFPPRV